MPAGPAAANPGVPRGFAGLRALPQGEVTDVVLGILVRLDPLADPQLVGINTGQAAVRGPGRNSEEDRSVIGPIGVIAVEQRADERDHFIDVTSRPRQDVRGGHPQRGGVGEEAGQPFLRQRIDPHSGGRSALDDLVVNVGHVHDPRHVEAAVAEIADEQVGEQERPKIADVGRPVDRGAAGVDPDTGRFERDELADLATQGVAEADHRMDSRSAIAWAEIPRPAPSMPSRLPVEHAAMNCSARSGGIWTRT